MKNATDITVVLDRSGSMISIREAMEEVLNGYVAMQKTIPGECKFSLVQFDSTVDPVLTCEDIHQVPRINLIPRGMTALFDAVATTIDNLGERLNRTPEHNRPDKVIFIIITDGQENASRQFMRQQVFDRITHQTNVYNWQFIFMGANQDSIRSAGDIGIQYTNAVNYDGTKSSVKGMGAKLNRSTNAVRLCSASVSESLTNDGTENSVTDFDASEWDAQMESIKKMP